jgi:predicted dehydrogenase
MKVLRVAVIGVGSLGQHHARVYAGLPGVSLTAVVDTNASRAQEIAQKHGCRALADFGDLFGQVDAVSVVVPTTLHYAIAKACLEHGLQVLVEKPMTTTVSQAEDLIRCAAANKLVLQVGHIERFNSALRASLGAVKTPRLIECRRWGPFTPRGADVSVVLDLMIHDLDIVLSFVDAEVQAVEAQGISLLTSTTDIAQARVTFSNGCVATFSANRVADSKLRELRVYESESVLVVDLVQQIARLGRRVMSPAGSPDIQTELIHGDGQEPLKLELQAFVESVANGTPPEASGREGAHALGLAESIMNRIAQTKT